MKAAVIASTLACAGSTLAASAPYFNLVAVASGKSFDRAVLKANGGWFYIGSQTNSTCGDVSPAITVGSAGSLAFYGDGKENQQRAFVDISGASDGLLGYSLPDQTTTDEQVANKFSIAGAGDDLLKVYYNGDYNWLACPGGPNNATMVYPANAYAKSVGQDQCTKFQLRAKRVDAPTKVCVYN